MLRSSSGSGGSSAGGSGGASTDLLRLVHHILGPAASEDVKHDAFEYSARLLASYVRPSFIKDEQQMKSLIIRRVDSQQDMRTAAEMLDLLDRFLKLKTVSRKVNILHFLLLLEGTKGYRPPAFSEASPEAVPLTRPEKSLVRALKAPEPSLQAQTAGDASRTDATTATPALAQLPASQQEAIRQFHSKHDDGQRLSEFVLVRDMLLVCQGLNGTYIKYNGHEGTFTVAKEYVVSPSQAELVRNLANTGLLFDRLKSFVDERHGDRSYGLIGQSFCSMLREELTDYYRFITLLETQISPAPEDRSAMTLRRLVVWMHNPAHRLKALSTIISQCAGVRGGQLLSAVFEFTLSGDTSVQQLARRMLDAIMPPFLEMLSAWVYRGVLVDTTGEFFISNNSTIVADPQDAHAYWTEKYGLSRSMLPSFVSDSLAVKVLLCGKSINFARVICGSMENFMKRFQEKNSLTGIKWHEDAYRRCQLPGREIIEEAYKLSSSSLLRILEEEHKLHLHLRAMRRYLLLGQGDLFMFLMEDLSLFPRGGHLLGQKGFLFSEGSPSSLSNARQGDATCFVSLEYKLLEVPIVGWRCNHLPHEKGWDIFSLSYATEGPISAVLALKHMVSYQQVFKFLWRVKRMDFILSGVWSRQMVEQRTLAPIKELQPILRNLHLLGSEMGHFVKQIQHYLLFEVLETQWQRFMQRVGGAQDLDAVIAAHDEFVDTIKGQMFLSANQAAQDKLSQLRSIFDQIIKFQEHHREMHSIGMDELDRRSRGARRIHTRAVQGSWGTSNDDDEEEMTAAQRFEAAAQDVNAKVSLVARTYEDMVRRLLQMLMRDPNHNMKYLGNRIDFNGHYQPTGDRRVAAAREEARYGGRRTSTA
ncbi:hypothetical protein PTSG_01132 [Salpingoeca rosetta]|uniref:Uncharacterized protein n=1 Tax=Salpingoeca rosetta (strain ATCC 50818 / BSB-021) TaxID=946362 RepID=F2U0W7_SALR5|nr:uncharacterized protein PTSG_01132 [Salpingoeca rosetta]EGD80541.1 hypothetical protein PTSG_01132 [Salpingoeca rosetta]|eukprot:XP_004997102.1 hypothetical protein PTSG_01132 [Salpingoeca rosetta]